MEHLFEEFYALLIHFVSTFLHLHISSSPTEPTVFNRKMVNLLLLLEHFLKVAFHLSSSEVLPVSNIILSNTLYFRICSNYLKNMECSYVMYCTDVGRAVMWEMLTD